MYVINKPLESCYPKQCFCFLSFPPEEAGLENPRTNCGLRADGPNGETTLLTLELEPGLD